MPALNAGFSEQNTGRLRNAARAGFVTHTGNRSKRTKASHVRGGHESGVASGRIVRFSDLNPDWKICEKTEPESLINVGSSRQDYGAGRKSRSRKFGFRFHRQSLWAKRFAPISQAFLVFNGQNSSGSGAKTSRCWSRIRESVIWVPAPRPWQESVWFL